MNRTAKTLPIYQEIMEVNQIDNISTDIQPIPDHCMIIFNLHASEQVETEKFIFTEDWNQVTKNLIDWGSELKLQLTETWYEPNIHAMWDKLSMGSIAFASTGSHPRLFNAYQTLSHTKIKR